MTTQLERSILQMEAGTHACLIFDTAEEQFETVAPFILDGLRQGHHCLYAVDDCEAAERVKTLTRTHPEVLPAIRSGALRIPTQREVYLPEGRFQPDAMLAVLDAALEDAAALGADVFRATGEMGWALGPETGNDRLIEYEIRLNDAMESMRAIFICQYDRQRFPAEILRKVLLAHPTVIVGSNVHSNPFYGRPELLPRGLTAEGEVDWMLDRLEPAMPAGH